MTTWPEALDGAAAQTLKPVIDAAAVPALRSVLVAQQGRLVAERYFGGMGPDMLQPLNSVTKSVASLLVGQALAQGRIGSLSQTVGELLPEMAARFPESAAARATLRQVLTGQSLIAHDMLADAAALRKAADPLAWIFQRPALEALPAPGWTYNDAAVALLAPVLEHAWGQPLEQIAQQHLFQPLGITRFAADRDGSGRPMAYAGLRLTARDHLKLAWLAAHGGQWQGAQVVPRDWVAQSTQRQGPTGWRVPPVTDIGYGFLWFTGRLHGHAVAWGWGYGAQFALAVPALQLAVATNAVPSRQAQLGEQNRAVMAVVADVVRALG